MSPVRLSRPIVLDTPDWFLPFLASSLNLGAEEMKLPGFIEKFLAAFGLG